MLGKTMPINIGQTTCMVCMDDMSRECTRWVHSVDGESDLPSINPMRTETGVRCQRIANFEIGKFCAVCAAASG